MIGNMLFFSVLCNLVHLILHIYVLDCTNSVDCKIANLSICFISIKWNTEISTSVQEETTLNSGASDWCSVSFFFFDIHGKRCYCLLIYTMVMFASFVEKTEKVTMTLWNMTKINVIFVTEKYGQTLNSVSAGKLCYWDSLFSQRLDL